MALSRREGLKQVPDRFRDLPFVPYPRDDTCTLLHLPGVSAT
jgi:hypothetical protein